ncbi:hypothetical protein BECAL_02314 [Bellilinea caldifistulae]|jgi:hypothetical protein|uniref:Uncharacterized protein n=1 Tax=Bellilinea caldifistulae TaxID=360411 RepID=A0A0P6XG66_9CHLR|nr:hypothetical protein [Bellilinea caldifistulae]KPL73847.1 hypothetical protein AC812_13745 [Bellilinea caldifistulae]GAP11129.1 hypothetical protein BECAL_02314 [Bellilinea caldifistulae]
MTTVIHYFGPETETNDEKISERALQAIENSDVEIKLHDFNKFDVLVKFEDDDPIAYTFQINHGQISQELVYICPNCGDVIAAFYAETVTHNTILELINKILDHNRRHCLATMELSAIRHHLLSSLNVIESNDAYVIAASIYYLAEVIRRVRR